jgi:hypothetical protein
VNATIGPLSCTTVTITDNEPVVQFAATAYTVAEGSAAGVIVKRAGSPTNGIITVNYAASDVPPWSAGSLYAANVFATYSGAVYKSLLRHTSAAGLEPNVQPTLWALVAPGTAVLGSDYPVKTGTLTFPACATTGCTGTALQQTISVATTGDYIAEPDEAFQVCLSSPTGASLFQVEPYCTSVKITNNDLPGVFTIDSTVYSIGEDGGALTITVKRTGTAAGVTVDYATADGTATVADSDYTATSGTLTFNGNETTKTITVPVTADANAEPNETFSFALSNPTAGATLGTPAAATVWLINR